MKILQINKFHYLKGGAERCYFDTARILREEGHRVAFFAMQHPANQSTQWQKYFISQVDFHAKQTLWQKIKIAGKIIYNPETARKLEKLILDFKPDVAHLHNIYHQLSPSVIYVLKKHNIPMVMTLHDYNLISPAYNLYNQNKIYERACGQKFYRCFFDKCVHNSYAQSLVAVIEAYINKWTGVYKNISVFISPSKFLRDKFYASNFKGSIECIANPLKIDKVETNKDQNIKPYIFYAGRLAKEKGVDILIKAHALQKNKTDLIIAGAGPEKINLQNMVDKFKVNKTVKFIGHQDIDNIYNLMAKAETVIIPSRCYENTPYSLREALELTRMVVCANVGGIIELAKNNQKASFFELNDKFDLANKIDLAIENSKKIKFESEITIDTSKNYYQELITIYNRVTK